MEDPVDPVIPADIHHFGGAARTQRQNAVQLLHDIDIIQSLRAGYAPAHIFKAAGHVLLPVQVVGGEAGGAQGGVGIVQHLRHRFRRRDGAALQRQAAALLQRQRVDGDVVRAAFDALVQRVPESLRRVGGQSGNEIHVHMGEAHGGGQLHGGQNIRRRVPPPDGLQYPVIQRLGVDADAVRPVVQQHLQLLPLDGVGTARLDAVLHHAAEIETAVEMGQQVIHLRRRQGGGGAAAHIEGFDAQPRVLYHLRRQRDLPLQRLQIRLHQLEGPLHRLRDEAAIGAAGGAEGDADVQGDVVGRQPLLGGDAGLGRLDAHSAAGRRHLIGVRQLTVRLAGRHAAAQQPGRQLGGPHAGETAPGGNAAQDLHRGLEKAHFQRPLTQSLLLIGGQRRVDAHAGKTAALPSLIADAGGRGGVCGPLRKLDPGAAVLRRVRVVDGPLVGEKRQQVLLDGVAVVVTGEDQLHSSIPCFI